MTLAHLRIPVRCNVCVAGPEVDANVPDIGEAWIVRSQEGTDTDIFGAADVESDLPV